RGRGGMPNTNQMDDDDEAMVAPSAGQHRSLIIAELLLLTPPDEDDYMYYRDCEREGGSVDGAGTAAEEQRRSRNHLRRRGLEIVVDLLDGAIAAREGRAASGGARQSPRTTTPRRLTLREALGCDDLPSTTASGLASCLVRLMSYHLVDADDDEDDDEGGVVATSTSASAYAAVSPLAFNSALLYLELIGTEGAWGLGMVDAGGMIAMRGLIRKWEFYIETACVALGMITALLSSSSGCILDPDDVDDDVVVECREAASTLERALRSTVMPPSSPTSATFADGISQARSREQSARSCRGGGSGPRSTGREDEATALREKRSCEAGTHLLRGLLPLFNLRIEAPNGHAGKLAAFEAASALVVSVMENVVAVDDTGRRTPRVVADIGGSGDLGNSSTPKRGWRKSVGFSQIPAASDGVEGSGSDPACPMPPNNASARLIAPPSLKKSVTPHRASRSGSSAPSDRRRHPVLALVVGLLQRLLTTGGIERADARSRVCLLGVRFLAHLPVLERCDLLRFVGDMCESKVSCHRLLGVEMIGDVMCQGWFWKDAEKGDFAHQAFTPSSSISEGASVEVGVARTTTSSRLLRCLQGRLSDKSPTVRTRAALSLGEMARTASEAQEEGRNLDGTIIADMPGKLTDESVSSRALAVALCRIGTSLTSTLRQRASKDGSATVRKSFIVAWLKMLNLAHQERREEFLVSGPDITALCRLCNDASVATRKAAADGLTKLIQANNDGEEHSAHASSLEVAWAHTVLPLVSDAEATCVTKAVEFFSALVIEPIIKRDDDAKSRVAWRILSKLSGGSNRAGASRNASGSLILALQKLLLNAGKDMKMLSKNLLNAVYRAIGMSLGLNGPINFDSSMTHENGSEWGLFEVHTTEMRTGAWCLLDALTSCLIINDTGSSKFFSLANISLSQAIGASQINSSFLVSSLRNLRGLMNSKSVSSDMKINLIGTSQNCLKVIAIMGKFVPLDDAEACFSELSSDLKSFTIPVDLISATVNVLITFTKRMCDDSGKDVFVEVKGWVNSLLNRCEQAIESQFSAMSQRGMMIEEDENFLSIILYFIGELSLVGFTSQEDSSLLTTKTRNDITPTDKDPVRGLLIRPSSRLVNLVKLMLPNTMPIPSAADHELTPTPVGIRAHSFVTLGKLCLRDESLAKESLNIFARELHKDSDSNPIVQSNSLMVMGDLCVRYTNLVDKYLPFMAASLQAGDGKPVEVNTNSRNSLFHNRKFNAYSMVKKNAIMLLSSLLLQDYIKWRGLLIHRFLAAVADEDDEVAQLAQTALRGPLLQKQPSLFANHFVGAVFVLNMCKAHPVYNAELGSGDSGLTVYFEGASFSGSIGYHKRREVYEVMLANMNDAQKVEVTARLVKEVLGGALETTGDLSAVCKFSAVAIKRSTRLSNSRIDAATNVLTDTLNILSSPQIRVGRKGVQDAEFDYGGSRPDQRKAHKQHLLTRISRKHLMEIVIPILCNLKSVLESSHSPILKFIMTYLGCIFRNYKSEVQEYLANQPILLQELEYDTRQYEKEQKQGGRVSVLPSDVVIGKPV
ncbi:hypothetical protein ACHAXA_000787, partial [Cyclostephanos tholiformis]